MFAEGDGIQRLNSGICRAFDLSMSRQSQVEAIWVVTPLKASIGDDIAISAL